MEILSKILGNGARVKIMRLFLLNKGKNFTAKEIIKRSRVNPDVARRELRLLFSIGFIKKRGVNWSFNSSFKYGEEFEELLIRSDTLNTQAILANLKKTEAEIGTELIYAIFDTKEFIYRLNMYDKLVRDILDYPHEVILQAKELSTQVLKKV